MSMPTVSVVVPVYNVESYLARCVNSILEQTYQALDVILIDDGSIDSSGHICDAYAESDSRVRVIHQGNRGLSVARNRGIDAARGSFLLLVDSDDWISENFVENLVEAATSSGADLVVGGVVKTGSVAEARPRAQTSVTLEVLSNVAAIERLVGAHSLQMVTAWGKLYRRELYRGVRFPPGRLHEDVFTTHVLLWKARAVAIVPSATYFYWQRPGSITSALSPTRFRDLLDAYEERYAFLRSVGLAEQAAASSRQGAWAAVAAYRASVSSGGFRAGREWRPRLRRLALQAVRSRLPLTTKLRLALHTAFPYAMARVFGAREQRRAR